MLVSSIIQVSSVSNTNLPPRLQSELHSNTFKVSMMSVLTKPKQPQKSKCGHDLVIVTRKVSEHHLYHE
jgi:hypothetical protein